MSKHIYYTEEQEGWLRNNYHNVNSYFELTELFNKTFHADRQVYSVKDKRSKRLSLKGMPNSTTYGKKKKRTTSNRHNSKKSERNLYKSYFGP